ncbi:Uncharacterized protein GBIM_03570 [Gryllus bimaculatus]|nr:Uncharacterized protein GBIM_03570 [Gryllus bimaculatus]
MQRWQCIEEDFSSEDETSNFSNRKIFTAKDRIEEWLTLRTFETASEVLQRPSVRSTTSVSGKICVAINETVFVFNDDKCSDLIISINVGSEVDCCCFIDRANVLLVATRKGEVTCVSFQGHVVFVRTISTEMCGQGYTFVNLFEVGAHQNRGTYNAVLVDHRGSIYRISWHENPHMNKNVDVAVQILKDGKENNKVSSAILTPGTEWTIACLGSNLTLWSGTSENICNFADYDLKECVKAQMWKEKFFVCLTSEGELALMCAKTLLCCTTWHKFTVQDFIIVKDENDSHKENIALLSALNSSSKCITILSLPELEIKHEVKISEMSWFISSPFTVMCIEGYSSSDNVVKLKIIILSKCHPRQRLQLCLKEHKFDEAEALARQFDLDVEIVFKEKASFFVKTLSSQIDRPLFNDLIHTLDQISDIQFVTSFCAEQCVCQMRDMKSMLRYALKRIQTLKKPLPADIEQIYLKISTKFRHLQTISLVKDDISFNHMKWRNILDIDWLKALFTALSDGNIEKAKYIWLRHLQDGQIIKEEEIKQLIVSISPSAKLSEVLKWLQLIIPYIQQYAPDIMECLVKWVVYRSKLMENDEQWPWSAINFVEEYYALTKKIDKMEEDKPSCSYGHNHKYLLSFLSDLRSIESLRKNYGIKIQLQDFLQENKLEVAKNILKKVTHHDVDRMLNGYMKNFIEKHNLSIDSVVLHFIEKLLTAFSDHWIHLSVSHWEPVMMTCISYVQSVQEKVKCILAALKFAIIPWSDAMKKLAAEGCKLNHPQVIEIKRLEKLAEIKLVFKKYRLPTHLLGSSKLTVFIYLMRKIILEAHDEMLKDALIIAEDSIKFQAEAYSMCLHYYISGKMCNEAQIILENMKSEIFEICTQRLLCRIESETDLDVLYGYIDVMNSVSFRLSSVLNIRKDMEYIRNLHLLNLNFGYKVTFQDFSCEKKRNDTFKMWIKSLVISGLNKGLDVYSLCKDAKYIAQLCFFPSGDGFLEIFKHLSKEIFISEGNQIMEFLNARSSRYSKGKLQSFSKEKLMKISGSNPDALVCCKIMTDCILNERLSINDPWLHILSWINRARDISRMSVCYKTEQINDFRLLNVFQDCPGSAWKPEVIRFVQCIFQSLENNNKEERDEWFLKYQCSNELPAIAEWRLPFWPNNMDKVIKSELTLNNYEQWLHMTGTLKMSEDLIRVIVLKQLSNMPELTSNDADWCMENLDEIIIDQIYNCAEGIVNQELACAVLYRVLGFTKCGAPKGQLAKLYSDFAKKWAASVKTNEAEQIMRNATQTYLDISTSNILYKYGINNPCYLEKISKPDVLVKELYAHPDIVNTNQAIKSPDINSAVNEISRIHDGIRWKELLLKLLEQWLAPSNLTGDKFDETITIQGNLQTLRDYEQNEIENFTRASYLLSKHDSDALLVTLLEVIFGNGKERSIQFKRNALTCIMSTLSMEEVSNLCGKAPDSIREHLNVLQFVSDLDSLGYIMTVSQFVNCKKYDLVMELLSSGQKNRPVLSLAAQIALRFQVFDSDIWEQLLKNMVQGCMSEDLEEVLGKLPPSTTGIVEAWTYVFFLPFRSCSIPLSEDQRKWCLNSFKLLYKCQVTDQIDLVQMGQFCCQFGSPHWAAMMLPLASSEQVKLLKKKILNNSSISEVLHKLEDIEDYYVLLNIKKILEETEDENVKC